MWVCFASSPKTEDPSFLVKNRLSQITALHLRAQKVREFAAQYSPGERGWLTGTEMDSSQGACISIVAIQSSAAVPPVSSHIAPLSLKHPLPHTQPLCFPPLLESSPSPIIHLSPRNLLWSSLWITHLHGSPFSSLPQHLPSTLPFPTPFSLNVSQMVP